MTRDEAPHFMGPNEDCMGNPTPPYWRQFLKCSDGNYIIGTGRTQEECEYNATIRRQEREQELNLSPEARLKNLSAGELCDRDMKEAIRLLIKLALRGNIFIGK